MQQIHKMSDKCDVSEVSTFDKTKLKKQLNHKERTLYQQKKQSSKKNKLDASIMQKCSQEFNCRKYCIAG